MDISNDEIDSNMEIYQEEIVKHPCSKLSDLFIVVQKEGYPSIFGYIEHDKIDKFG